MSECSILPLWGQKQNHTAQWLPGSEQQPMGPGAGGGQLGFMPGPICASQPGAWGSGRGWLWPVPASIWVPPKFTADCTC